MLGAWAAGAARVLVFASLPLAATAGPAAAQTLSPGETVRVTCAGQWSNIETSPNEIAAECAAAEAPPARAVVVGHAEVALFGQVSLERVQRLRVMSVNRSVGWNISQGIERCLAVDSSSAPNFCRRWAWNDGSYAVPPMTWTAHPLPNWRYFGWPGSGISPELPCPNPATYLTCFESYVDANAASWDVVSMQPSYLDAGTPALRASDYLATYERLRARHPRLAIVLHTASLARVIGTQANHEFNEAVRAHVAASGGLLLDVADIESTDPFGAQWFHNGYPAITPYYTARQMVATSARRQRA